MIAKQETVAGQGAPLENMMDKFPEYKFVPSALMPLKRNDPAKYYYRIAWPLLLVYILPGVAYFAASSYARKKGHILTDIADYISTEKAGVGGGFAIFVKNRKFGLVNIYNQIIIPAEYDKLSWTSKGLLFAERNGKHLLLDSTGSKRTKEYDKLTWSDKKDILVAEKEGIQILVDIFGNELN